MLHNPTAFAAAKRWVIILAVCSATITDTAKASPQGHNSGTGFYNGGNGAGQHDGGQYKETKVLNIASRPQRVGASLSALAKPGSATPAATTIPTFRANPPTLLPSSPSSPSRQSFGNLAADLDYFSHEDSEEVLAPGASEDDHRSSKICNATKQRESLA